MPVPWSLLGWRPLPNFIPRIIHQGPASPTYVLPPSTEPIWQNWAKKALKIWPFNLLLFNQLRKISYLIKKHSKTTKTWKYNLLLNVYILELVLLHHHLWPFQVSPNSSQCGIGLEGILKSQQAEVVTVARQIVTEDLEALSVHGYILWREEFASLFPNHFFCCFIARDAEFRAVVICRCSRLKT